MPDEELRRVRAASWRGADDGGFEHGEGASPSATAPGVTPRRRYVLWFEADLYDQLQIIQILARLAALDVPAERITLICIGEHPGIARFGGLGELTADQLCRLPATAARH